MRRLLVPYHLDEHLPDLVPPVPVHAVLTVDLPAGDPWTRLAAIGTRVRDAVATGERPTAVLSGDCLVALGVLAGLQADGTRPGVVWLDAHPDLQAPETTGSGYLGGFPLRLAVGHRPDLIADRIGLVPVPEDRVLLVGARDLDPPEADHLRHAPIRRAEVRDLATGDLDALLPPGPLYLHVDLDVVDPGELPGLRFAVPGGPDVNQVTAAIGRVLATGRVAGIAVACTWYPDSPAATVVGPGLAASLG